MTDKELAIICDGVIDEHFANREGFMASIIVGIARQTLDEEFLYQSALAVNELEPTLTSESQRYGVTVDRMARMLARQLYARGCEMLAAKVCAAIYGVN